jgi:hypothetical protein
MSIVKLPIYVPSDVLEALGAHTGHFWSDRALEPIIADAILASIKPPPAAQQQQAAYSEAGYQWKQVFLPEGTRLRACFDHQPYFATVEGSEIKYEKHSVSPSCFANLHGSGNRNAWKAVWLRFPGSEEWLLADVCRSARKAAIARLLGENGQEARPSSRAAPRRRQEQVSLQPSRRIGASAIDAGRPLAAPAGTPGNAPRSKNGSGKGGRRKRRGARQARGNP